VIRLGMLLGALAIFILPSMAQSSKATGYTGYEIGNSSAWNGNRLLLFEVGWNFN
jgi:hypothetical protein